MPRPTRATTRGSRRLGALLGLLLLTPVPARCPAQTASAIAPTTPTVCFWGVVTGDHLSRVNSRGLTQVDGASWYRCERGAIPSSKGPDLPGFASEVFGMLKADPSAGPTRLETLPWTGGPPIFHLDTSATPVRCSTTPLMVVATVEQTSSGAFTYSVIIDAQPLALTAKPALKTELNLETTGYSWSVPLVLSSKGLTALTGTLPVSGEISATWRAWCRITQPNYLAARIAALSASMGPRLAATYALKAPPPTFPSVSQYLQVRMLQNKVIDLTGNPVNVQAGGSAVVPVSSKSTVLVGSRTAVNADRFTYLRADFETSLATVSQVHAALAGGYLQDVDGSSGQMLPLDGARVVPLSAGCTWVSVCWPLNESIRWRGVRLVLPSAQASGPGRFGVVLEYLGSFSPYDDPGVL